MADTPPQSVEAIDLAALVGSRLCHDLISPLGAIGNGIELLGMTGAVAATSPEFQMISEAVANANARVKFFRVAFGQAGGGQRLGRAAITTLLADLAQGGRLSYDWQVEGDQARSEVKLVFLAALCLEAALPWGGQLTISRASAQWQLEARARRTKRDDALWAMLAGAPGQTAPAQVQFALLPMELARQRRHAEWEIGEDSAAIRF